MRLKSVFIKKTFNLFFILVLKVVRCKIVFQGFDNDPSVSPVVFVANHQSSLDVPLIGSAIYANSLIWLARSELQNSLLLRFVLKFFAIVTDVNSPQRAASALRRLLTVLKKTNASLVIFPEGSRYNDGLIHDFFNGFAFIAQQTNRPVVPILIENAYKVYPRGSFLINRTVTIKVTQGLPFYCAPEESFNQFAIRVHQWFLLHQSKSDLS